MILKLGPKKVQFSERNNLCSANNNIRMDGARVVKKQACAEVTVPDPEKKKRK